MVIQGVGHGNFKREGSPLKLITLNITVTKKEFHSDENYDQSQIGHI